MPLPTTTFRLPAGSRTAAAWRLAAAEGGADAAGQAHGHGPGLAPPPPGGDWAPLPLPGALAPPAQALPSEQALAAEKEAQALASQPGPPAVPFIHNHTLARTRVWAERKAQAEAAGVDLRKKTFINKLISVGASLVTLGVAAALAAASGGAATPLVIIAAARTLLLIGDAGCAWTDWRRSQEREPRKLPLGANCLGNLLYSMCTRDTKDLPPEEKNEKEERAKRFAKAFSGVVVVGLASANLALGLPEAGMSLLSTLLRYVSNGGSTLGTLRQARTTHQFDRMTQARDQAASNLHLDLLAAARASGVNQAGYQALCDELRKGVMQQGASDATLADLDDLMRQTWASRDEKTRPNLTGADRATLPQQVVNDLVGFQSAASLAMNAAQHGGIWGVL